jgi:hypothetical protein
MPLLRFLLRALILIAGAVIGLGLFLIAVLAFVAFLFVSLLTGRKPNLQFRVNQNPWARRQPPAAAGDSGDVVDIEAREVKDAAPLPLQAPLQPPR